MSATEYRHPGLTLEQRVKAYLDSPIGAPVTRGLVIDLVAELAEARASVVTEEPEWEYGYELIEPDTRDVLSRGWPFDTAEQAQKHANDRAAEEFDPELPALIPQVVRRRKAGAWLAASEWAPVKQEGAET